MVLLDRLTRFSFARSPQAVERALRYRIRDAYAHVSCYRAAMDGAGVTPDAIRSVADLALLPVTTRRMLLAEGPEAALRRGAFPARGYRTSTSGSQGIPFTITFSRAEALWRTAMFWRAMLRYVWLLPPLTIADVGPMAAHAGYGAAERARLARLLRLPATLPLEAQVAALLRERPQVVEGYPTCLALLAEALAQRGETPYRPRLVVSRGEVLHAEMRALLERTFHCRVADLYNCEEVGNVAWSCPHDPQRWHINTAACVVEIVDADGAPLPPGVEGRMLLTSLFGRTMPFIRYDIGDRGTLDSPFRCACGVRGPTLTSLSGRDDDFLWLPDGRRVSPRLAATTVFNALKAESAHAQTQPVRQFQIVQQGRERLILRVVLSSAEGRAFAGRAAVALAAFGWPCEVQAVAEIPFDASGKLKKVLVIP